MQQPEVNILSFSTNPFVQITFDYKMIRNRVLKTPLYSWSNFSWTKYINLPFHTKSYG